MAQVILYSKNNCPQCRATEVAFRKYGIMYTVKKVDEDENALTFVRDLGYDAAPVVWVNEDEKIRHWSGFRKDMIDGLRA